MLYPAILNSLLSRYLSYAAQVASLMILARIFSPREYGTVASVQVFFVFFQMLAEAGFGPALVNIRNVSKREIGGIFSITILVAAVFSAIFWFLGGTLERFYSIAGIARVVPFAAAGLFFCTVAIVPTAALNREMRFLKLAQSTAVAEIVSTAWVLLFHSVADPLSALASKVVVSGLVQFVLLYVFSSKTEFGRLSISFQFSAVREILWFSMYQFLFSFVNYFSRNLDNILVGRVLGATSLGIYDKAYQLMKYPLMLLTFAMTPAIQPALRKHREDGAYVENVHRDFVHKLAWLGFGLGSLIVVAAPWIIRILLGHRWDSVTPIIRELALAISVQVVLSTSGGFFQAMNRPDLMLVCGLFSAALLVSAIMVGIWSRDLIMMSWLISLAFNCAFFQCYFVLYKKVFRMSPWLLYARLRGPIMLNLLMLILGCPIFWRAATVS